MTKDEFKGVVAKIKLAYPQQEFIPNAEAFNVWYEMLNGYDIRAVRESANNCIKTLHYPPSIADIISGCENFYAEARKKTAEGKLMFYNAMSYFPETHGKEQKKELWHVMCVYLRRFPLNERMEKLYQACEKAKGQFDKMTFEEFVKAL